jgi:hypothetical protein
MKATKRERLRRAGFRVGGAADFLGLSDEERALVAMKVALVDGVKALRGRASDDARRARETPGVEPVASRP